MREIVARVFKNTNPEFVPRPEAALSPDQRADFDLIDSFPASRWCSRLKKLTLGAYVGLPVGIVGLVGLWASQGSTLPHDSFLSTVTLPAGLILTAIGVPCAGIGGFFLSRLRRANKVVRLKQMGGFEALINLLHTKEGRKTVVIIRSLAEKTRGETA